MDSGEPRSDPLGIPSFGIVETNSRARLAYIRVAFLAGTLVSVSGFALPWFRINRGYSWWYGG